MQAQKLFDYGVRWLATALCETSLASAALKALRLCIRNKQLPEWQRIACNVGIYAAIVFGSIALVGAAIGLSVVAFIVSPILGIFTWSVTFSHSFIAVMHFSQRMEDKCIKSADK